MRERTGVVTVDEATLYILSRAGRVRLAIELRNGADQIRPLASRTGVGHIAALIGGAARAECAAVFGWQLSSGTEPTRSGRCSPVIPMFARSWANVMLTGVPLCHVVIPETCQPPRRLRRTRFGEFLRNGMSYR